MEKRILAAVGLSLVVMVAWLLLVPQPAQPPQTPASPLSSPVPSPAPEPEEPPAEPAAPEIPAASVSAQKAEEPKLETDVFEIVLTNRGGRVRSWRLKSYFDGQGHPLELVPEVGVREDALPFAIDLDDEVLAREANEALYVVERELTSAEGDRLASETVRFRWADGKGLVVEKSLRFQTGGYLVDAHVEVSRSGRPVPARISWGPGFASNDALAGGRFHYGGQAVVNVSGQVKRFDRNSVDAEVKIRPVDLLWAGLEEQYFTALVLPAVGAAEVVIRPYVPRAGVAKEENPEIVVAVGVPTEGAQLFVGPKKYTLLRSLGRQLDKVIWFASDWPLIGPLIDWLARMLFLALLWIHDRVVPNYGLAIVLLTVAVRVALFPVNQFSMVNMRKMQLQMQRVQPKINAIKNKYKKKDAESRSKINQETMALYQKEGINPLGSMTGCLPMLAQFPILIAFYNMLVATVELRGAPFFGWIKDLNLKDPYWITPILMGVTMFLQQWMSMTKTSDPAQAQQQRLMLFMPIVFTVMFINLPSGLVLYWLVNNLLGIAQQWLVNRHMGRLEAAAQKA